MRIRARSDKRRSGGGKHELTPDELAMAAVMAAAAAGVTIFGTVVPAAAAMVVLAVVPFGVVAERHRPRATVAALVASAFLAGLIVGLGAALGVLGFALLGGFVGYFVRRGWGLPAVWLTALLATPLLAGLAVGVLALFASYRKLVIKSFRGFVKGLASILDHARPLRGVAHWLDHATVWVTAHWLVVTVGVVVVVVPLALFLSWFVIGRVLDRLRWIGASRLPLTFAGNGVTGFAVGDGAVATLKLDGSGEVASDEREIAPLPVRLQDVSVRFGEIEALRAVSLEVGLGEFVAVIGDNGSGKSTLARVLAGAQPSAGTVERHGLVGLGKPGGTAFITQRPDAQVIGLRVCDDILWGLPDDHTVDIDELLDVVGLNGFAMHDTGSLSGGQLQRLAVASALARRPSLLISDESTAMIDLAGRRELTQLYRELPRRYAMSVVHITHHPDEAAAADRVIELGDGSVLESDGDDRGVGIAVADGETDVNPRARQSGRSLVRSTPMSIAGQTPLLELRGVGYEYGHGTLWESRALEDITLDIAAGEGVLVVGENGSGKSTLAWILAGLTRPTSGTYQLDGRTISENRNAVAIAFQHARLQLQRPTVGAEIIDAAGWSEEAYELRHSRAKEGLRSRQEQFDRRVLDALFVVGLRDEIADRTIESLSGGQQRRVVLAGLLARKPQVLVLDEPLAGLDAPSRTGFVELLTELRMNHGVTLIVVTHDPEPLASVCPRTVRLDGGRLVADTAEQQAQVSA